MTPGPPVPTNGTVEQLWSDVDPRRGRVPKRIYVDPAVHEAELERLFARCWLFVGHETQIPSPGDFVTAVMGADPMILTRDAGGALHLLLNSCRHRGMRVCKVEEGNCRTFRCQYHGWTYDTTGALVGVPLRKAAYFNEIDASGYGLVEARVETYKGLVFGTWWHDGPSLREYLGDMTQYLDIMFDRLPGGVETIAGVHKYEIAANWKILSENSSGDQYHLPVVHSSAVELGLRDRPGLIGHTVHVGNGHCFGSEQGGIVRGRNLPSSYTAYLETARATVVKRNGEAAGQLVPLGAGNVFPNLSFLDTVRFRLLRLRNPIAAGVTEVWGWALVDRDIPAELKDDVRRQVATFFGPSGLFEQDDMEVFATIQETITGYAGRRGWFSIEQGVGHDNLAFGEHSGTGMPGEMGAAFVTEENHRAFYRRWLELMNAGPGPDPLGGVNTNLPRRRELVDAEPAAARDG